MTGRSCLSARSVRGFGSSGRSSEGGHGDFLLRGSGSSHLERDDGSGDGFLLRFDGNSSGDLGMGDTEQSSQPRLGSLNSFLAQRHLLAILQDHGSGSIFQAELSVGPDGRNGSSDGHSDTGAASESLPFGSTLDAERVEDGVNGRDEVIQLGSVVAGSGRDAETFFADSDGGVVDRLNVDAVVGEERVGGGFRKGSVTNKNGNNVRGPGAMCKQSVHESNGGLRQTRTQQECPSQPNDP